jgi:hypothetical protein
MNRKAIDYGVIQRDVDSNKQIYDSLLQRAKETGVSGELRTSNVRIVDRAEPATDPVSPRRLLTILGGLFGGAFLGIGFAFLFEYLDNRVKTPEEIERELGIPSLGLIPVLPTNGTVANPLISDGAPPTFSEAFRALRTNILFSAADGGPPLPNASANTIWPSPRSPTKSHASSFADLSIGAGLRSSLSVG